METKVKLPPEFKDIRGSIKTLIHDVIEVAIGIIIKPNLLNKDTLIIIFKVTDATERQKGVLVSFLAKKKFENIINKENAGTPIAKKVSAIAVLTTLILSNEP